MGQSPPSPFAAKIKWPWGRDTQVPHTFVSPLRYPTAVIYQSVYVGRLKNNYWQSQCDRALTDAVT